MKPEEQPERIAIVSPYTWETAHPVNDHVAQLAAGLTARTPAADVVVIAPSNRSGARRATRRALRDLAHGAPIVDVLSAPELRTKDGVTLLAMALPVPIGSQSVALRAGLRQLFEQGGIDLLVVQDPLVSDLTRQAVRLWKGLAVGVFHELPAAPIGKGLTAPLRERLFEGLDLLAVPADPPGFGTAERDQLAAMSGVAADRIALLPTVARPASLPELGAGTDVVVGRGPGDDDLVRDLLRGASSFVTPDARITLLSRWTLAHRQARPRTLTQTVRSVQASTPEAAQDALRTAAFFVTTDRTPYRAVLEAVAMGLPVLAWPDPMGGGPVADPVSLPTEAELAAGLLDAVTPLLELRQTSRRAVIAKRSDPRATLIDLHMHTAHSWDCATDPEALMFAAREAGLTAIAVTDHDEIAGGLACAPFAEEYGVQVIVGEEVKTAQGEVIGLFLTERIPGGMTWIETIAEIRRQDGLVYVPHPFDRLHTIPDIHTLRSSVDEIDVLEVCNGRLAFEQFNRDAARFARKYNLLEGAGSDAHVIQGLASAAVRMPAFTDQESFLTAIRQGTIERRPSKYAYVQTLKRIEQLRGKAGALRDDA